jgi:hypothetical protein
MDVVQVLANARMSLRKAAAHDPVWSELMEALVTDERLEALNVLDPETLLSED